MHRVRPLKRATTAARSDSSVSPACSALPDWPDSNGVIVPMLDGTMAAGVPARADDKRQLLRPHHERCARSTKVCPNHAGDQTPTRLAQLGDGTNPSC